MKNYCYQIEQEGISLVAFLRASCTDMYSRKFTNDDTHISGCNIIRCHLLTVNSLAVPHSHYTVLLQYYLDEISHLNHSTLYCMYSRKFTNDDTHISGCTVHNIIRCHLLTVNYLAVPPHSHSYCSTILMKFHI